MISIDSVPELKPGTIALRNIDGQEHVVESLDHQRKTVATRCAKKFYSTKVSRFVFTFDRFSRQFTLKRDFSLNK